MKITEKERTKRRPLVLCKSKQLKYKKKAKICALLSRFDLVNDVRGMMSVTAIFFTSVLVPFLFHFTLKRKMNLNNPKEEKKKVRCVKGRKKRQKSGQEKD